MRSAAQPRPGNFRVPPGLVVEHGQLASLCRRWKIQELALFGSAARGSLRPDSDIDLLVRFTDDANWGLLDHITLEEELSTLLGRRVDLVTRRAIERSRNALRRDEILGSVRVLYAA